MSVKLEGTWLSLYPRDLLAEDATVSDDDTGFSGITLAHNVSSKEAVGAILAEQRPLAVVSSNRLKMSSGAGILGTSLTPTGICGK